MKITHINLYKYQENSIEFICTIDSNIKNDIYYVCPASNRPMALHSFRTMTEYTIRKEVKKKPVNDKIHEELQKLNSLTVEMEEAQTKLQEESQKRYVTEQQCEELLQQLQDINEKIKHAAKELDLQKNTLQQNEKHKESLKELLTDVTRRNSELKDEIALFCSENFRLKEMKQQVEKRSLEKAVELEKLAAQIADVDEGFSVRLKREKDNGEQMKQQMEKEIAELERDIAMYRATATKAQEQKEEIKQKMQAQITRLTKSLEESQQKISDLQTRVSLLY